ncbi:hypothetical protein DKX38_016180 [Salix brachista]|uniref:Lipoyl-binding domain-containing protein n=1 Tax=Salix brachista TaxID=2182728 RepID=A0A5N5L7A5_9ROSI|nr:hypothetical protein DKX38_016180 [Salix brachista]
MESSLLLRSFQCNLQSQGLTVGRKLVSYPVKRNRRLVSCVKTSEAPAIAKTNDAATDEACLLDSNKQGTLEKNSQGNATFPNGFEALILDVCDETEVAELKLKVGDFEMHLKRNTGVAKHPFTSSTPPPPPIPTSPMEVSAAVSPAPSPSKSSVEKTTPFTNVSFRNSSKLAALEASGASGYVLVASPTVGSFRSNRTVKGKKQSPICKEGDETLFKLGRFTVNVEGNVIKEGQVIGYLDQFGTELPVKSDVAGEVLKLLFDDGGYKRHPGSISRGYECSWLWRPSYSCPAIISCYQLVIILSLVTSMQFLGSP